MNTITISRLSKRYGYNWIVKDFNHSFASNIIYGIAGSNGSGKSTLIKMLSGFLTPSTGDIIYQIDGKIIPGHLLYKSVSLVAPYTDLVNEYTLEEMFNFHQKFKPFNHKITFQEFQNTIMLHGQNQKILQHFSSGMKQKIQLSLAMLSDTPILLLDEPTSFLDKDAKQWFTYLLSSCKTNRIIIIASNDPYDLNLCDEIVTLQKE
jgi:ABC-type multidrug transport system ATPase subunit